MSEIMLEQRQRSLLSTNFTRHKAGIIQAIRRQPATLGNNFAHAASTYSVASNIIDEPLHGCEVENNP
ncbi:hypothetical protein [Paenibacillus thalictri]|uniref:hypothetical protein n=1 Tax=Paenibacillus thalictri TaxID=2527873 RepID=UPI0013EF58A2|nr:hypothetical protein [Paenibacillus thalictri]